jgi:hypothetical protein
MTQGDNQSFVWRHVWSLTHLRIERKGKGVNPNGRRINMSDYADEIHVTFTWAELQALIRLLNALPRDTRTVPLAEAWIKLADALQANDPPERAHR